MARRIRFEVSSGNHLRSSVPRAGVLVTTPGRSIVATTSGSGVPPGISTTTHLVGETDTVEHTQDIGELAVDAEVVPMPPTITTTEPENIRTVDVKGKRQEPIIWDTLR